MGFNCGIVGLPNVGKSTIFNALTAAGAEAANYPFCTIEPNVGVVAVPDARLEVLAKIGGSAKIIPTSIEFVDIAGLVKGASEGEGLGNQFLGHIRAVDAIVHVVRCFDDSNVTHVYGRVSPKEDVEIIETELMLADLASVESRLSKVARTAKTGDKEAKVQLEALEKAKALLDAGIPVRTAEDPEGALAALGLISAKPVLYLANVSEADVALNPDTVTSGPLAELVTLARSQGSDVVVISGVVESEITQLDPADRPSFLNDLGLESSGLDRLAVKGYSLLDLITFFTVGPKETHAWTCKRNSTAPVAAGKIHSDFEKGFIRAEVISYNDYVSSGGELGAKDKGLLRVEGKTYIVADGDVVHFRFNV